MKAIISTTHDPMYQFFLPITTWCWNKLGVDVICFLPQLIRDGVNNHCEKFDVINYVRETQDIPISFMVFECPENKEATYAQCSRLYGACLDLPEDEVLITGDVDMAVFKLPMYGGTGMGVVGLDLVPKGQIPICYIYGTVSGWNKRFNPDGKTYQQCLDEQLGHEEMENMRGNLWSRDQEIAYNKILGGKFPFNYATLTPRSNGQNQFATNRIDRDDTYFIDRLTQNVIDYHMHRPGYTEENIEKIISVISYFYPTDDLNWIREYAAEYRKLL